MKKAVITLLLVILLAPFMATCCYADGLTGKAMEITGINQLEDALPGDAREISGKLDGNGTYDAGSALARLWRKIIVSISDEIKGNVRNTAAIVAIALASSLAGTLTQDKSIQGYINVAGVCAAAGLLTGGFDGIVSQTSDALTTMSDYSRAALPAVFSAAAACGAVVSASARYAAVCMAIDVLMNMARSVVIPLTYAFLALALCVSIFDNPLLKTCQRFVKWLATTFMTGFTIIFSGYIGLTGIVTGSADAVAVRTARTVISTTLPVVGGIISDAASTVLAAAGMIKNSAGALSLVAVCALCAGPFVMLSVKMLLFRAAAAACDMVPNAKLSGFINDVGTALSMRLGLVGCCAILLFISFTAAIKVVTV